MLDGWDDEQLLTALGEAMRARQAVPDSFIEMGKSAYAWHNIDAELAQLTYDSQPRAGGGPASETASIRALTFTSAHLTLELEVTDGSLLGQVIPPRSGTLEIQTRAGTTPPRLTRSAVSPSSPSRPARSGCATGRRPAPTC